MFAGNEAIKESIISMLKRDKPPASFMVVGPSGCGKTTLGRIIAKGLGCHKDDFNEMNTANDRGVKAIRQVLEDMKLTPLNGKKKVILFDEAHQLTSTSQEALLKGLEEPPSHVHFIVCTTNPEALKDTFKRRCHIYEVAPLKSSELISHMKTIIRAEKLKTFPDEIIDRIIELSNGSPGIALKNLDMVIDMGDDIERAVETLKSSGTTEAEVIDICRCLVNFSMSDSSRWVRIRKLLSQFRGDGESARRPILGYLAKCLLGSKIGANADAIEYMMSELGSNFYDNGKSGLIAACYACCKLDGEEKK